MEHMNTGVGCGRINSADYKLILTETKEDKERMLLMCIQSNLFKEGGF